MIRQLRWNRIQATWNFHPLGLSPLAHRACVAAKLSPHFHSSLQTATPNLGKANAVQHPQIPGSHVL